MNKVPRADVVDYQTYEDTRDAFRKDVMAAKDRRRFHLGEHLTFLFENALTVRYQIQEMMRVEKLVREDDILHELKTYNALIGDQGQLGATLLIEIAEAGDRDIKLRAWFDLPEHLYALLEDGTRVRPLFDESQRGRERLSSVQYLKFAVGTRPPIAFGCDLPQLVLEQRLSDDQRAALAEDLAV